LPDALRTSRHLQSAPNLPPVHHYIADRRQTTDAQERPRPWPTRPKACQHRKHQHQHQQQQQQQRPKTDQPEQPRHLRNPEDSRSTQALQAPNSPTEGPDRVCQLQTPQTRRSSHHRTPQYTVSPTPARHTRNLRPVQTDTTVHLPFQLLPFAPSVGRSGTCLLSFSVSVRTMISLTSTERQDQHHSFWFFLYFLRTIFRFMFGPVYREIGHCKPLVLPQTQHVVVLSDVDHYLWAMLYRLGSKNSIRKNEVILQKCDREPHQIFDQDDKPVELRYIAQRKIPSKSAAESFQSINIFERTLKPGSLK